MSDLPLNEDRQRLSDIRYTFGDRLGSGAFWSVFRCTFTDSEIGSTKEIATKIVSLINCKNKKQLVLDIRVERISM